jgi:tight adherence protein C
MGLIVWIIVGAVVIGAGVLVIIGLKSPQDKDPLQDRLADFVTRGESASLEEIELSQPFVERVIYPMARRLGELAVRFTPQNAIQNVAKKLDMAGNPGHIDPTLFFAFRFFGIPLGLVVIALGKILPNSLFATKGLIIAIPASVLGFYLPDLLLKAKIDRRQDGIRKAMPDALDLLTICVEAGLGFEAAMAKVYEKWDNELARAFGRVLREIQLGKVRKEALRDMAERLGITEMTSFVAAVIQSEQLGVSMAQVLRIQADQMRIRRRQLAEEKAHQAPVKMLIPMGIFIFPSICIVLMTPAVLILIKSNAGAVFTGGG